MAEGVSASKVREEIASSMQGYPPTYPRHWTSTSAAMPAAISGGFVTMDCPKGSCGVKLGIPTGVTWCKCSTCSEIFKVPAAAAPPAVKTGSLVVLQFNVLAEGLSAPPAAPPPFPGEGAKESSYGGFTNCPEPDKHFDFSARRWRLLNEILLHDADVLTLQEVDHFENFFAPALAKFGYAGVMQHKDKSPCCMFGYYSDGVAIFYKTKALRLDSTVQADKVGEEGCPHIVASFTHLLSGEKVTVATAHLKSKEGQDEEDKRTRQIEGVLEKVSATAGSSGHVVLAGDFNTDAYDIPDKHEARAIGAVQAFASPKLRSAYPICASADDPAFSTWKVRGAKESKHFIDYIWHSSGLHCANLLSTPTDDEVEPCRLPGPKYPSDHLAIGAQFFLTAA